MGPVARTRAPLFGLAPCGVLPATRVATGAVRSYRTFSPLPAFALRAKAGGIFSVPLSFGLPRPGITRRTALRSSDFPPTFACFARFGGQAQEPYRTCSGACPPKRRRREGGRSSGLLRRPLCLLFCLLPSAFCLFLTFALCPSPFALSSSTRPLPAKSRTAPASCTGCCAACL
jgi:hypothetical protein